MRALMTGSCAMTSTSSSVLSNDRSSKRLPRIFRPKLTHPAARSLCDSWATCKVTRSRYQTPV